MKVAWTLILPYGWKFKELLVALKVWKGVVCVHGHVHTYVDHLKRTGIRIRSITMIENQGKTLLFLTELIYMSWNFDHENSLWYALVDPH